MPSASASPNSNPEDDLPPAQLHGWRLWRLELCNWGTFHDKVWSLLPTGNWSLLVGENGSGKTTAIDGLRTLLVPPRLLNYNDASGGQKRRDRSRQSYIRGAWAARALEESYQAKTEYLRAEGAPSFLLGVFRRANKPGTVTLAQVLWINDQKSDELFLIADSERTIRGDLSGLKGGKREFRTELRKRGWDVHESFSSYAARFCPLLGIPGEGALEVFNQAIGVKDVDDVNAFVRRHLLEKGDALSFIRDKLTPLYKELMICWDRIQEAERQIARLTPIAEAYEKIEVARGKLAEITQLIEVIDPFYFEIEKGLRETYAEQLASEKDELDRTKTTETEAQKVDEAGKESINAELNTGSLGTRLKELEYQMKGVEREITDCKRTSQDLLAKIAVLELTNLPGNESQFTALQQHWKSARETIEQEHAKSRDDQVRALTESQTLQGERRQLTASLAALKKHKVNIDGDYLRTREEIAQEARIPISALPFAGELMEVKEEYRDWTGAIERLLRGFGLSLLVPEQAYGNVSRIINHRHWNLRLQFFRVPADAVSAAPSPSPGMKQVVDRLVFRDDHRLAPWVAAEIKRAFPHTCCDDESELGRSPYGITRQGLMRSGARHLKDDRYRVDDATRFILGWSLENKLRALTSRLATVDAEIQEANGAATSRGKAADTASKKLVAIDDLLKIAAYSQIDVAEAQRRYLDLKRQSDELEQSSDRRRALKRQLADLERTMQARQETLNGIERRIGININTVEVNERRLAQVRTEYAKHPDKDWAPFVLKFAELRDEATPVLEELESYRAIATRRLQGRQQTQNGIINNARAIMLPAMAVFLQTYSAFTASLSATEPFAPDFVNLLARLEKEELPAHKARFEEHLSTELIGNMAMVNTKLGRQLDDARERIAAVNVALKSIAFTATTYVQISERLVLAGEIGPFKARIRDCIAGGINADAEDRLRIFQTIRALLEEFAERPDWADRVTDVRNWLEFGVRELAKEDNKPVDYFSASSGKSGGQKTRLALTILASAILAQYGLAHANSAASDAFRLVVIDEVFSRTDEENSRRALDLFQKLGLQLIVVSPFDAKARIVEEYVESYHLALNPNRNNSSLQRASREQYEQAWSDAASTSAAE